ncbi:MAG: hypothetical protein RXR08_09865 [Sulfolobaceae archaeon]|uniref:hypothetical protein n=1 Tax=Stygiolobus sp. CP850M TaxID=3133134 RepID=UPI00307F20AC
MLYQIRETKSEGRERLYFYETRNEKTFRTFKATLSLNELVEQLYKRTDLKYKRTKKSMFTDSERLFKLSVVYSGVRQTMRYTSPSRILTLSKVLVTMEEYSLHFWYSEFVTRYTERKNVVDTYKVGRAFRDLYDI